jgi:hypothetical protein
VLLAIYFFLAGCVVSQNRMLWVMPAASAVFACLLALTAAVSSLLSSSYRQGQHSPCTTVPFRSLIDPSPNVHHYLSEGTYSDTFQLLPCLMTLLLRHSILWTALSRGGVFAHLEQKQFVWSCRSLSTDGQAWWCADVVHIMYSGLTFSAAALYVACQPRALLVSWAPSVREAGLLPDLVVCTSAGFFAFQLWMLVRTRCALPLPFLAALRFVVPPVRPHPGNDARVGSPMHATCRDSAQHCGQFCAHV